MTQATEPTSSQPYLVRAWHEWCTDNGLTPYVTVSVDNAVQVPREYVKDDEIVLNVSFEATTALIIGNEFLEFKGRFSGSVREIIVPLDHISAIFARENGQGMAFPKVTHRLKDASENTSNVTTGMFGRTDANSNEPHQDKTHGDETTSAPPPPAGKRPALTRIK